MKPSRLLQRTVRFAPLLAAMLLLPPAAQAATGRINLQVSNTLPAWSSGITDYTVRCQEKTPWVRSWTRGQARIRLNGRLLSAKASSRKLILKPGQRAVIDTRIGRTLRQYSIRCLPSDFPRFQIKGLLPASMPFVALGSTDIGPGKPPYAFIVDRRGVPLWWKKSSQQNVMDIKGLPGGRVGMWQGALDSDHAASDFAVYRLDGTLLRTIRTTAGGGDGHEAYFAQDGSVYRTALVLRQDIDLSALGGELASIWDNQIEQISPNGEVLWRWSALDRLGVSGSGRWYPLLKLTLKPGDALDLFHLNSIEQTPDGNLIVSLRHQDAVYKISKQDGHVIWKLGGSNHTNSLQVQGQSTYPEMPLAAQHDARVQSDGSITMYDNGSGIGNRPPRAVRWSVDESKRQAQQIEMIEDAQVKWSAAGGSARRNSDGSWLVGWCHSPLVRAYNRHHQPIWSFQFPAGDRAYRAQPISPGWMSRSQIVSGMDRISAAKG